MNKFDVVIIGGGNAGFGVSAIVSEAGKSIAFIEERDFGGTCPNRGCTPKKVLVAAAHALHEIEQASVHCIEVDAPKLDWAKLIARKDDMIGFIPDAMYNVAAKRGKVFRGTAKFTGSNSISVDGQEIAGEHIVIATGSKPRPLPIPGAEHMITSEQVLSQTKRPDKVVFIGGGVVAMEFAHVYARAGTKVTILEAMPQLLPRLDADAVAAIQTETERLGVTIHTNVKVNGISQKNDGLNVNYTHGDHEHSVPVDCVINGTGRVANVETLDLSAAGIKHDGIRIEVDENLRSVSNPSVWVAGDALVHTAQLSPVATYEGRLVGKNIVSGAMQSPDYSVLPTAVYTVPAVASLGITEADALKQGLDVSVKTNDMTTWFSSRIHAQNVAYSKIIIDKNTDLILGAHMVGHRGEEIIHIIALAMRHGITASELRDMPMAFPTFSSDIKNLL